MDVINKTSTCKKGLDVRIAPNRASSMVAEHNFFIDLAPIERSWGEGEGGNTDRSLAKTIFRSHPSKNGKSEMLSLILNSAQERQIDKRTRIQPPLKCPV